MSDNTFDDDLFEPFDLDDEELEPEPTERRPVTIGNDSPARRADYSTKDSPISCPSCGSSNPPFNRHCEACGARLADNPLPVAPPPMVRKTSGARALTVLASILIAVVGAALVFNVFGGDGSTTTTLEETTTTTAVVATDISELRPVRVQCDSDLPAFPCQALIDGDPETRWNAESPVVGQEVTFFFSPPVQISEMYVHNVDQEEPFLRNARMKGLEISVDDLPQTTPIELIDSNEPQRIQVRSLKTTRLTITISSAYAGQSYEGREPFTELAAQEITFFGRVAPEVDG